LANFAYDPINYEYLRQLNVIDLFLGKYNFVCSLKYLLVARCTDVDKFCQKLKLNLPAC